MPVALALPSTDDNNSRAGFLPQKKTHKPVSTCSFFEKTETESERFKFHAVEIEDISTSCYFRSETLYSRYFNASVILYGHWQHLFTLHCVFLV
jgi:hypothetical protein